jgi:rhodanese-related sulfurtransferase
MDMQAHRVLAALMAVGVVAGLARVAAQGQSGTRSAPGIAVVELRAFLAAGAVLVIDVRGDAAYDTSHIPGAVHVPFAEIARRAADIRSLAAGRLIVTYCSCPDDHASAEAASMLIAHGISNVRVLIGGYRAWVRAVSRWSAGSSDPARGSRGPKPPGSNRQVVRG